MSGEARAASAGSDAVLAVDDRDQAADHARVDVVAVAEEAGVEAVLPAERVGEVRRADVDADDAPAVEALRRARRR